MKKLIKSMPLMFTFLLCVGCSNQPSSINNLKYVGASNDTKIKNVIVMIGDGMGVNHVDAGGIYQDEPLIFDSDAFKYHAYMDTDSLSSEGYYLDETKSLIDPELNKSLYDGNPSPYGDNANLGTSGIVTTYTDSAAGGTALSTGVRVTNSRIGIDQFGNNITNIVEIASSLGKKTGVVSSDYLDGATPSSFATHSTSRHDIEQIYKSYSKSPLDIVLTAKNTKFTAEHEQMFKNSGFDVVYDHHDLDITSDRIMGQFKGVPTRMDDRALTLAQLTAFSLDYLDNDDGFFLMVEGANIDKQSHSHQSKLMINELLAFNDAVEVAYDFASNRNDTLIVVTADHETGAMYFDKDNATQDNIIESINWLSYNHSRARVDLKVNIDISNFTSLYSDKLRTLYDLPYWKNIDVFNLCVSYLH